MTAQLPSNFFCVIILPYPNICFQFCNLTLASSNTIEKQTERFFGVKVTGKQPQISSILLRDGQKLRSGSWRIRMIFLDPYLDPCFCKWI